MLDHRQKYALEMAVFELVNAVHSTRNKQNFDKWINVESILETIEDIRSAFPEMEGRIDISSRIRKSDQVIHPYQFGHDASKSTCLWLKNLPLLRPTQFVEPRMVDGKKRWGNQTDSGQNKLGPSDTRWKERSKTYQGIAQAMAKQWGTL